ncbi:hypothetical protein FB451DRAFT_1468472 [Mycena latifolia]|nr:hypothetical protein FB451DRAFT_1468472 [Mycena latifolia]
MPSVHDEGYFAALLRTELNASTPLGRRLQRGSTRYISCVNLFRCLLCPTLCGAHSSYVATFQIRPSCSQRVEIALWIAPLGTSSSPSSLRPRAGSCALAAAPSAPIHRGGLSKTACRFLPSRCWGASSRRACARGRISLFDVGVVGTAGTLSSPPRSCISILVPTFVIAPPTDAIFCVDVDPTFHRRFEAAPALSPTATWQRHSWSPLRRPRCDSRFPPRAHPSPLASHECATLKMFPDQARRPWRASIAHALLLMRPSSVGPRRRCTRLLESPSERTARISPYRAHQQSPAPRPVAHAVSSTHVQPLLLEASLVRALSPDRGLGTSSSPLAVWISVLGHAGTIRSSVWSPRLPCFRAQIDFARLSLGAVSPTLSTAARLIAVAPSPTWRKALAQLRHRRPILLRALSWFIEGLYTAH